MKQIFLISLVIALLFVAVSSPVGYRVTANVAEYFKIPVEGPVQPQSIYYVIIHAIVLFITVFMILYLKYLPKLQETVVPPVSIKPPSPDPVPRDNSVHQAPLQNLPDYQHPFDPQEPQEHQPHMPSGTQM